MSESLQRRLVRQASASYRPAGPWAWHFARGKLARDPVFAALLRPGLLPATGRYLDLGCGQGLLASWLRAATALHAGHDWPAEQPAPPRISAYHGLDMQATAIRHARQALADCDFPTRLDLGDLRDFALPDADVITLFDVLHYLPGTAQESLLQRIRVPRFLGALAVRASLAHSREPPARLGRHILRRGPAGLRETFVVGKGCTAEFHDVAARIVAAGHEDRAVVARRTALHAVVRGADIGDRPVQPGPERIAAGLRQHEVR